MPTSTHLLYSSALSLLLLPLCLFHSGILRVDVVVKVVLVVR